MIATLEISGFISYIAKGASPFMNGWLGLPAEASIPLIFGILRKELTLILFSELIQIESLTHIQMVVFSLVVMIYIPCLATIAACKREFGWRKALAITVIDVALALFLGGIACRLLSLVMPS